MAEMKDKIAEQVEALQKQVARLQAALEKVLGSADAVETIVTEKVYKMVQFARDYSAAGRPLVNRRKAPLYIEGYFAKAGQIAYLPEFEIAALEREAPGLLITDKAKFLPQKRREFVTDKKTGRPSWQWVDYPAADMVPHAQKMG